MASPRTRAQVGVLFVLLVVPVLTFQASGQDAKSLPAGRIEVGPEGLDVREGETLVVGRQTELWGAGGVQVRGRLIAEGATFAVPIRLLGSGQATLNGTQHFANESALEVGPAAVAQIGPSARIGRGAIHVWGRLTVKGEPGATVNLSVPILAVENASVIIEHARLFAVNGTAFEMRGGEARVANATFRGNTRALLLSGAGRLVAQDAVFEDHAGEAVWVEDAANVTLLRPRFQANGRGVTLYSATHFSSIDGSFSGNSQHVVVDLGPWSQPGDIILRGNLFAAPAPSRGELPAIHLRHDVPLVEDSTSRVVRMASNRIEGAPVGLRAEGRGLLVESVNDTFVDNVLGIDVQLAAIHLDRATLGNDRDIDGPGRWTVDEPTFLRAGAIEFGEPDGGASWLLWAIGGAIVVVLLTAAVFAPRLLRRPPAPAVAIASPETASEPPAPATPAADLGAPITPTQRRILDDILAHPGTPQRAVADRLGYTRQALHYHVKKLESRGLVVKALEGRETRCTVPPAVASILSAAPGTHTESQQKP